MPNRPTHPRIALPPALAARVDALRALAPMGRPSRQAVVEAALAAGLGVLEASQGGPGGADGAKADPGAADAPTGLPGPALARRLARQARAAGLDASARAGVVTVTAAPIWHPTPGDPRWALGGMSGPYARESHVVAVEHDGRRVEVAVCAGDTVAIVRQALAAAWQARDGLAGDGKA